MVRSVTPKISAASHHFNLPAIARRITSCTFIIRSISAAEIAGLVGSTSQHHPPLRTDHVLIRPDRSHANNTRRIQGGFRGARDQSGCRPLERSGVILLRVYPA